MIKYWTTANGGDVLLIKDMKDSHIINAINYVKRKSKEWIEIAYNLWYATDNDYIEYEYETIYWNDVFEHFKGYYCLCYEAKKRKLIHD